MRLIDADALLIHSARVVEYDEAGFSMEYNAVPVEVIKNAPTVEANPVVHCKDCNMLQDCKIAQYLGLEGYCSNAEKKVE